MGIGLSPEGILEVDEELIDLLTYLIKIFCGSELDMFLFTYVTEV
jgi:hypothetical protein